MLAASKACDMRRPCWYPFINVSMCTRMYVCTHQISHTKFVASFGGATSGRDHAFLYFGSFLFLGATSGALTTPFDVLKTRIMTCTMDCAGGLVCGGGGMSRSGGGGVKVGV
jgi:hypothetical protein